MPVVRGTAYWASVTQPNIKFEPCWTIDLCISKEAAKVVNELCEGVRDSKKDKMPSLKLDEEKGGYLVKIKQKCTAMDGKELKGPKVVTEDGEVFTGLVGNGSDVSVLYTVARTEYKSQGYVSLFLRGVKIHNLVKFAAEEEAEDFFGGSKVKDKPKTAKAEEEEFFDDDVPDFK
jgi:hypothetical protein